MCGLVGLAGHIGHYEEKAFRDLLVMDTVRGFHSTGMAIIGKDRQVSSSALFKLPVSGGDFVRHEQFSKMIPFTTNNTSAVLIGHNRQATVGQVNTHNAHPFHTGSIIGAHNGTLPQTARQKLANWKDYTTDSEALLYNIHKDGAEMALGSVWGAWALTYWDFDKDSLFMVRNDQRPLSYTYTKDRETLMWASEWQMLWAAADRNNLDIEDIQDVPVDEILEFKIPKNMSAKNPLKDPEKVGDVFSCDYVSSSSSGGNYSSNTQWWDDYYKKQEEKQATSVVVANKSCDWCSAVVPSSEIVSISGGIDLCKDCHSDPEVVGYAQCFT